MGNSSSTTAPTQQNATQQGAGGDIVILTEFLPVDRVVDSPYVLHGTVTVRRKRSVPRCVSVEFETRRYQGTRSNSWPNDMGERIDFRTIDIDLTDSLCVDLDNSIQQLERASANDELYGLSGRFDYDRQDRISYGYSWPRNTEMWTHIGPMRVEGEPAWKIGESEGVLPGWTVEEMAGKLSLLCHLKALALSIGRLNRNDPDVKEGYIQIVSL